MKNKLLIIGILLTFVNVYAQQTEITLDDAIKMAIENNREIEIAKMDVKKANAAVSEAFGYALPSVDLSGSFSHFIEKPSTLFPDFESMLNNSTYGVLFNEGIIPTDNNKLLPMDFKLQSFAQSNNIEASAQVTQILFNSAVFTGIGASEIYLNIAKENLKSTIANTVLSVKKAYYGVLLAKELYHIAELRFKNASDHLSNIRAMKAQGLVAEFAELQVEVQVENIRPMLVQLKNANIDAINGLKILTGISQDTEIAIVDKMEYTDEELPNVIEFVDEARSSNFSLNSLKIKKQLDDEYVSLDKGEYWPTLAAFGNYTFSASSDAWDYQHFSSAMVGLNLSINLFQGGRTANKVEQSLITSQQTKEQIHSLTDATEMQVKSNYNDLMRVKKEISAMGRNVLLAERAYKIANNRYKEGEGSELEVKDADIALSDARVNYTRSIHDYLISKASLDNIVGRIDNEYYNFAKKNINELN
jgi:outer membrane protein TolC